LIFLACVFDFLDGFAARLLKVMSPIGKELDSLADVVTFGVLPGIIMYRILLLNITGVYGKEYDHFWVFISLLIPVFSALRLAKFNVDTRQSEYFLGLPTPANAIFIASLALILEGASDVFVLGFLRNPYYLSAIILISSGLLVSEIRLLALKFKGFGWKENVFRYLLIIISIVLFLIFHLLSIPFIIIIYIILSLIEKRYTS
ncbi:MAG: CDP-alcohol phosphatidyltransferase family protein, partial [Cytophagaceae bacterium]